MSNLTLTFLFWRSGFKRIPPFRRFLTFASFSHWNYAEAEVPFIAILKNSSSSSGVRFPLARSKKWVSWKGTVFAGRTVYERDCARYRGFRWWVADVSRYPEGSSICGSETDLLQLGTLWQIRNAEELPIGTAQLCQGGQAMEQLLGSSLVGLWERDEGVEGFRKGGGGWEESEIVVVED